MTLDEFVDRVRNFVLDKAATNHLNLGQEILDSDLIKEVVEETVSDWNSTPPFSSETVDSLISGDAYGIFIVGVAYRTIVRYAMLQAHNKIQYSDEGFSVAENARFPEYQALYNALYQEYEQKKNRFKYLKSIAGAMGGGVSVG